MRNGMGRSMIHEVAKLSRTHDCAMSAASHHITRSGVLLVLACVDELVMVPLAAHV